MSDKKTLKNILKITPSSIAIILGNLVVIVGAIFFEWELFPLVLLYWLENAVIGLLNSIKMITSTSPEPFKIGQKLFMVPFFWLHYGGFMYGHGIFIFSAFGHYETPGSIDLPSFQTIFNIVIENGLQWALLGIIAGHLYSLVHNYYYKGEYKQQVLAELMGAPYGRIAVLHIFIILGGFIIQLSGSPRYAIVLLAIMKTIGDLAAHNAQHLHVAEKSRMREQMKKVYDLSQQKGSEKGPDAFLLQHPGYTRDKEAEKKYASTPKIGCCSALLLIALPLIILYFAENWLPKNLILAMLGLGVLVGIGSIILYNYPRKAKCPKCFRNMDILELEAAVGTLTASEQVTYEYNPSLEKLRRRWLACHRCKLYFCGMDRTNVPNTD